MFLTLDDVMTMAKLVLTGTLVPATDDIKTDFKKSNIFVTNLLENTY